MTSRSPDHDNTFHVTETPALTTQPSVTLKLQKLSARFGLFEMNAIVGTVQRQCWPWHALNVTKLVSCLLEVHANGAIPSRVHGQRWLRINWKILYDKMYIHIRLGLLGMNVNENTVQTQFWLCSAVPSVNVSRLFLRDLTRQMALAWHAPVELNVYCLVRLGVKQMNSKRVGIEAVSWWHMSAMCRGASQASHITQPRCIPSSNGYLVEQESRIVMTD